MNIIPWILFLLFTLAIFTVIFIESAISNTEKRKTTGRGGDFHE